MAKDLQECLNLDPRPQALLPKPWSPNPKTFNLKPNVSFVMINGVMIMKLPWPAIVLRFGVFILIFNCLICSTHILGGFSGAFDDTVVIRNKIHRPNTSQKK